jgi:hypothetical protein
VQQRLGDAVRGALAVRGGQQPGDVVAHHQAVAARLAQHPGQDRNQAVPAEVRAAKQRPDAALAERLVGVRPEDVAHRRQRLLVLGVLDVGDRLGRGLTGLLRGAP